MDETKLLVAIERVETKVDMFHSTLTKHISDDDKVEERVRKIERKQSWFMGGMAAITVIFFTSLRYLSKYINFS